MEDFIIEEDRVYPAIALRGVSVLADTSVHFDVGREKSVKALEQAMKEDKLIFLSTQKEDSILIPTFQDVYKIGTIARVKQMLKISGDVVRVLVEGLVKAEIKEVVTEEGYMSCRVNVISQRDDSDELKLMEKAGIRVLRDKFIEYANLTGQVPDDAVDSTLMEENPEALVNKISIQMPVTCDRRQQVYETLDFSERTEKLLKLITEEIEIALEEQKINRKVKENVDLSQKEYFLKERIKAINEELGEDEDAGQEAEQWKQKLKDLHLEEKTETKILKEIKRFSRMQPSSAESAVIRTYVETILDMPWNEESELNDDLKEARKVLDRDHYGLDKVKERIIEYLAVIKLSEKIRGPILCLVGPPGVGKTSIAKSIATATGREFVRMSLGGVRDEAEIRGHRRTYIGAIPGNVISNIKNCGKRNPLFLFDEIDKLGNDFKGDPASALLEVLDPEQNSTFTDHYLDVPFDLSDVMFITTANSLDTIPGPLRDRMEIIELSGYTEEEKVNIAEKYLISKQVQENGLKDYRLKISEAAIRDIINYYTRESGVRNLERKIADICRKAAKKAVTEDKKGFQITASNLEKYLGKRRFRYDKVQDQWDTGVVNGMAWTQVGGVTLTMEALVTEGKGRIQLTGKLGDVMQESAKIAVSYIRSLAPDMGLESETFDKKDIHIHAPEGAVPKDGPSAGVTMFTAVTSALTGVPVRQDVAMTGEITLRGKVLPVGGIKEKVLAAHRAGIRKILLPAENMVDTEEIPENVRKELEFVPLEYAIETLDHMVEGGRDAILKKEKKEQAV